MRTFAEINDSTGFANGDWFASESEVRDYFTVRNMETMFGCVECDDEGMAEMAEAVLKNRWHCAF